MSSGTLPLETYHRAQAVGSGAYGSVLVVYNDDGEEFALKLFDDEDSDDEEEESDEDEDDDEDKISGDGISLGALREISILRILRGDVGHPNIIKIHDIQTEFVDDTDECGAGTQGYMGIAMPVYHTGSLGSAFTHFTTKRQKLRFAQELLQAVSFLHDNGIIHRDIKADNILLEQVDDNEAAAKMGANKKGGIPIYYKPILIDFSLAKLIEPSKMYDCDTYNSLLEKHVNKYHDKKEGAYEMTHTIEIGTPTYRSPEVVNQESYSFPSDMWSIGVVLLELLRGSEIECHKDNTAIQLIENEIQKLPENQPFPNLIRGLLEIDPTKRLTAHQALNSPVFSKFGLTTNSTSSDDVSTTKRINLNEAIPFDETGSEDEDEEKEENESGRSNQKGSKKKKGDDHHQKQKKKEQQKLRKRYQLIEKICENMEWTTNPLTKQAAYTYSLVMTELDDELDNLQESQSLLDCCVLAHKFYETDIYRLKDIENGAYGEQYFLKYNWNVEQYIDNENSLFMLLDFCLYPRQLITNGIED